MFKVNHQLNVGYQVSVSKDNDNNGPTYVTRIVNVSLGNDRLLLHAGAVVQRTFNVIRS